MRPCSKRVFFGTTRRPHIGDLVISPILLWGPPFMTGDGPKLSILDQKWPNMAGLSTFQSGPMGTKMANLLVFLTRRDPFGPFQTKIIFFAPNGQSRVWRKCFGAKSQFLFKMIAFISLYIHFVSTPSTLMSHEKKVCGLLATCFLANVLLQI